jgi:hypothetical protein
MRVVRVAVPAVLLITLMPSAVLADAGGFQPSRVDLARVRVDKAKPAGTGRLLDREGRPAVGRVAILAWPGTSIKRHLQIGDSFVTPTVGFARVGREGRIELRIDPGLIPAEYIEADGSVDLEAIGWTSARMGLRKFVAKVRNGEVRATESVDVRLEHGLITKDSKGQAITPQTHCSVINYSTYVSWGHSGRAWPYGSDKGWMKISNSHSTTVGNAFSVSGAYGSWSQSGTESSSLGVTFEFAESIYYRAFATSYRYSKSQDSCSLQWYSYHLNPVGTSITTSPGAKPSMTRCFAQAAGVWERNATKGSAFSLAVGMKTGPTLGVDLSLSTQYSSSRILKYRLVSNGKLCGSNNDPAYASEVQTSR